MTARRTRVVGVASGYGAGIPDCQDGSEVLRALHFLDDLAATDSPRLVWDEALRLTPPVPADPVEAVCRIALSLAERVAGHLARGDFPLVIGGDHSCAIGTWAGVRRSLGAGQRLGLVWIDAHMDSHTFETSPSRHLHGMPLACLLGHGDSRLTGIAPAGAKLMAADVCLVGVRSYEPAEAALLHDLGVRVFCMDEIRRRGLSEVFAEALRRVGQDTAGYGISIDLDALDPAEGPGVGTPVGGGLAHAELGAALALADGDERLLALEIVEYNPYLDSGFVTARAIRDLCRSIEI